MEPSGTEGSGNGTNGAGTATLHLGRAAGKPVRKDEIVLEERGLFIESGCPSAARAAARTTTSTAS